MDSRLLIGNSDLAGSLSAVGGQRSVAIAVTEIAVHAAKELVNNAMEAVDERIAAALIESRQSLVNALEPKLQQLAAMVTGDGGPGDDSEMGSDEGSTPTGSPSKRSTAVTVCLFPVYSIVDS